MLRNWVCLLSLSLLLLFWLAHMITRDGVSPVAQRSELRGYMRIGGGRMGQVRGSSRGARATAGLHETVSCCVPPCKDYNFHIHFSVDAEVSSQQVRLVVKTA